MQKRSEKEATINALGERFSRVKVAIVAEYNKLDVAAVTELRKRCRQAKVEYKVVKNTLARRAARGTSVEKIEELLVGPTALVLGYEDPVGAAKVLSEFIKDHKESLKVRGAMVEGNRIDAQSVDALAKLPGLLELRATIARMIATPATKLAQQIAAPGVQLARVVQAHADKMEKPAA